MQAIAPKPPKGKNHITRADSRTTQPPMVDLQAQIAQMQAL